MIRPGFRYLLDLVLYTHLWIAAGALALSLQTQYLITGQWYMSPYAGFVFAGSLFVYSLHRLVFIRRSLGAGFAVEPGRRAIYAFQTPLQWLCIASSLMAGYLYLGLSTQLQLQLLLPCLLSLGYVMPISKGKRLRDLPFVKLGLLVLAWTWLTALIPMYSLRPSSGAVWALLGLERACFIFSLGLAFDIRDIGLDAQNGLATLPGYIGARLARRLAFGALGLMATLAAWQAFQGLYSLASAVAVGCTAGATAYLISRTHSPRSDYYYLGLLDGMLLLQPLLIGLLNG